MSEYLQEARKSGGVQIAVFQYATALLFLWLLTGFWQLQVQSPEIYEARAERNSVKSLPLLAPRGKILDRDGRVLVDNDPSFKVLLSRASMKADHLSAIAEGLNIPLDLLEGRLRRLRTSNAPEYQAVILKENLSPSEVAFAESHQIEFPELEILHSQRRLYPSEGVAAHVVGYVGEISDAELDQLEFIHYEPGAEIGKAGIERQYNDALTGTDGSRLVRVDSRGREQEVIGIVEAKPGRNVRLTLDLDLQVVGELAMRGRRGAIAALDPRNGEILALVSSPSFDPNKFIGGISGEDWRDLLNNLDKPLVHRAIQAQWAPGSTFKPIVAWAGLDSGVVDERYGVICHGGGSFFGRYFRCNRAQGHGAVALHGALVQSCNMYFHNVGNKLGIDEIARYARMAGLGSATGVDLPHEQEGIVPSAKWKLKHYREKWYAGETVSVSIGQGALTVTPLQLASAIGGLAIGGEWHTPHLVDYDALRSLRPEFDPPAPRVSALKIDDLRAIRQGMFGVVNEGGTGGRARLGEVDICGKTGTSQIASTAVALESRDERLKPNAWFVGFAPCEAPEIVVAALYENGEHGHFAAPIARDVLKAYFDKKARLEWTRRDPPRPGPRPSEATRAALEPFWP